MHLGPMVDSTLEKLRQRIIKNGIPIFSYIYFNNWLYLWQNYWFYCIFSITIYPPYILSHLHLSHPQLPHCCLCPWDLFLFYCIPPLLSPLQELSACSLNYGFVCILLVISVCSLASTYEWTHMVFVFLWLAWRAFDESSLNPSAWVCGLRVIIFLLYKPHPESKRPCLSLVLEIEWEGRYLRSNHATDPSGFLWLSLVFYLSYL